VNGLRTTGSGSHPTPTGWTVLPCQTASLVFAARVGDSDDALILCPDQGALYDRTRSVFLPIAGASWPATGVGWVDWWLPQRGRTVMPCGGATLVEPVNGTVFQIACEASSSACTARPVGAVPTSASPLRAMSVFTTETNETMASLWVSGDHGTFVFNVSCSPTRQPSTLSPSLALTGVGANASSYSAALVSSHLAMTLRYQSRCFHRCPGHLGLGNRRRRGLGRTCRWPHIRSGIRTRWDALHWQCRVSQPALRQWDVFPYRWPGRAACRQHNINRHRHAHARRDSAS